MQTTTPLPDAPTSGRVNQLMTALATTVSRTTDWKPDFAELIGLTNTLLQQAQQHHNRIDFYDEVGVSGKIQDITSLVTWLQMTLTAPVVSESTALSSRLNRYDGAGTGYFANGSFFTSDYADDVAFFLDDQRIYLNHHIKRALNSLPPVARS